MPAVTLLALRLLLGLLLLTAALGKLASRSGLREQIGRYQLVPAPLLPAVAVGLPLLELLTGAALTLGFLPRAVSAVAASLFTVFTVGVVVNLARGRRIDCGCHGVLGDRPLSWAVAARAALLAGAAVLVAGAEPGTVPGGDAVAVVVLVAVVLCAVRLALSITQLRDGQRRLAVLVVQED